MTRVTHSSASPLTDHPGAPPVVTPAERAAAGRAVRTRVPRSTVANFSLAADRPDPIDLLLEQAVTRVPDLIPIRHSRMAASPFAFFRGAALPMAADLASMPNSGLRVQLCGDAHLLNFGIFGTPERRLVFDINDFDETSPGPFEWDVLRLTASLVLASRERGDAPAYTNTLVLSTVAAYRESMASFAKMSNLDVWYSLFDVDQLFNELGGSGGAHAGTFDERSMRKVRRRDSVMAAERTTETVGGELRFVSNPPLQVPDSTIIDSLYSYSLGQVHTNAELYRRSLSPERRYLFDDYRIVDGARRVVGVGSVGTRCYILLLLGRDSKDPLILQVKESQASVLERFAGKGAFNNHGERVVVGQKLTQSASDLFLGWTTMMLPDAGHRYFYLRQFRDWKASIDYTQLNEEGFLYYSRLCAWALAKAHARSGDQIAISAYLGNGTAFDKAVLEFSLTYADQTLIDHQSLVDAIASGREGVTSVSEFDEAGGSDKNA